jgi:hypothetical protein
VHRVRPPQRRVERFIPLTDTNGAKPSHSAFQKCEAASGAGCASGENQIPLSHPVEVKEDPLWLRVSPLEGEHSFRVGGSVEPSP